jgi:hypothetical protein
MFTPEQIQEIYNDLLRYIESEEDPTIVWFTSSYPAVYSETAWRDVYINKDFINNHDEFCELRKKSIEKQEAYLVKWATKNELNATMGVFRLKQPQHGYTDKVFTDNTTRSKVELTDAWTLLLDELNN